jgi:uncharacterized protein (TIGR00255 family)
LLKSMTGYGSSERTSGGRRVRVEVRSVNQRFLELQIKTPRLLLPIEDRIRRSVESAVTRGRVTVFVDWSLEGLAAAPTLDPTAARAVVEALRKLGAELSVPGDLDLATLARFPQIFESPEGSLDAEESWSSVEPVLAQAVADLVAMRAREGRALQNDVKARLDVIEGAVSSVERAAPEVTVALKARLSEKIRALIDATVPVDETRLAQEIAIAAERADFTEEVVRLAAHVVHARECLVSEGPVGKRLNFLVQEMHREANTIGSKCGDAGISDAVLLLKEEIEKLREQVQNVE